MSVRLTIVKEIETVAQEQGTVLTLLSDDLPIENAGLDSLCWAIVVARLEASLGIDPFTASEEAYFPVTLGEFIHAYEETVH
jgi:hypothetical protein